ncbi:non-ribosomal peptide synthetase [Cognatishimia sp. F0-27]|uniref:non-ribosomal peptide synthetase n=1 Tax=Cognatishimia sp. F0-27 TaxID=2816855 RepID=UPI001D0CB03C|nr:non-ribosomal peptide synthetase [Cognatishimia sp. F0-27]MCC1494609.1 amino acid adenylation domain-containing protein [Cognatishimia sp. F0-27]
MNKDDHQERPSEGFANAPDRVPATPAQTALWVADRLRADGATTNTFRAWDITGAFDPGAFLSACKTLAAQHDSLNSTLHEEGGRLIMTLGAAPPPDLMEIDLRSGPETVSAQIEHACRAPFETEKGPLFRARVFRTGAAGWTVCVVFHHAVMDGWSIKLFCTALTRLYACPSSAPLRRTQGFGAYARALAETGTAPCLHPKDLATQAQDLATRPLALPYDRPPDANADRTCGQTLFDIPAADTARLAQRAKALGITRAAILMAAARLTLFDMTGERNAAIGQVTLGRDHPGLSKLLGAFVITRAIRSHMPTGIDADAFLRREQEALEGGRDGPDTTRGTAIGPHLQVALNDRRFESHGLPLRECAVSPRPVSAHVSTFDLVFNVDPAGRGLRGTLLWNAAAFSAQTADRIAEAFRDALLWLVSKTDAPIDARPDRGETRVLRGAPLVTTESVPARLERAFVAHASRTAITVGDKTWRYAELDRASAAWAEALDKTTRVQERKSGIVALALPRGFEFVAALIGIWRSGMAVLPLAADDPPERLRAMLKDAAPDHLIAAPETARRLDRTALRRPEHAGETPRVAAQPDSLAYVMYTSGSTGQPKGVMIPHRAIATLVAAACQKVDPQPGARMVSASAVTFDSLFFECLLPLVSGGVLDMLEDGSRKDPWRIAARLRESDADYFFATPTQWRLLLEAELGPCPRLTAWTGGEALDPALAEALTSRVSALWNGYGPTETTVFATWQRVTAARAEAGTDALGSVPIGAPLPGYRVAVCHEDGRPCWPGALGELWVGGPAVARGYLGQPGLSARRFVLDPPGLPPGRWYRTGDLARVLPDGVIAYHGRADTQIKIGGQRVELGDIEARIMASGHAFASCVVLVADETAPELVAWVVLTPDGDCDALRDALRRSLPAAWVPRSIVSCDALPVTGSGKTDRVALTHRAKERIAATPGPTTKAGQSLETDTPLEQAWRRVLGAPPRAPEQNFFDAGGTSLLLIRMITDLRKSTGRHVSVADAFRMPTAAGLDRLLTDAARPELPSALSEHQPGEAGDKVVFMPGLNPQGHNLRNILGHMPARFGVYTLERDAIRETRGSFRQIAEHGADSLEQAFAGTALHVTGYSLGAALAFETACALQSRGLVPAPSVTLIDSAPVFRKLKPINPGFSDDARAMETMRRAHHFSVWRGHLTLLRADRDDLLSLCMPARGWEDFVTGSVAVHMLAATHAELLTRQSDLTARALLGDRPADCVVTPSAGAAERRAAAHRIADGNPEGALALLETAARAHPEHPWTAVVADDLAQSLGRDRTELLHWWLAAAPETAPEGVTPLSWHAARALAHARLNALGAALNQLGVARDLSPPIRDLEIQYAAMLHINGRASDALAILDAAAHRWGESPALGLQRGISLAKLGHSTSALPVLRQAVRDYPDHAGAQVWLRRAGAACAT